MSISSRPSASVVPALLKPPTRHTGPSLDIVDKHLDATVEALAFLRSSAERLATWGTILADRLMAGQRLLVAGNGGSAAEAQHLTAELVGRFDGERAPFSAIALHAETSAFSAIANDYGYDNVFARQVLGHGRAGDVLMLLSTSGRSTNLLRAVQAGRHRGIVTWAMTGSHPNPLAEAADEAICIDSPAANAQECHLVALHALCRAFDARVVAGLDAGRRANDRRGDSNANSRRW